MLYLDPHEVQEVSQEQQRWCAVDSIMLCSGAQLQVLHVLLPRPNTLLCIFLLLPAGPCAAT